MQKNNKNDILQHHNSPLIIPTMVETGRCVEPSNMADTDRQSHDLDMEKMR